MQRRHSEFRAWIGPTSVVFAALVCIAPMAAAPSARDAAWVDARVQEWQPTAREKRWEDIGWAGDLQNALALGRKHNRPIFLFTHDGRLNVGRC